MQLHAKGLAPARRCAHLALSWHARAVWRPTATAARARPTPHVLAHQRPACTAARTALLGAHEHSELVLTAACALPTLHMQAQRLSVSSAPQRKSASGRPESAGSQVVGADTQGGHGGMEDEIDEQAVGGAVWCGRQCGWGSLTCECGGASEHTGNIVREASRECVRPHKSAWGLARVHEASRECWGAGR